MNNNNRRTTIVCVGVIIFCFLLESCSQSNDDALSESSGAPVSVTHPRLSTMTDYLRLTATTEFLSREIVRSTMQGFVIRSYKNIGDQVRKGDRLFALQTREASALSRAAGDSADVRFTSPIIVTAASSGILSEIDHYAGDFVSEGDQIAVVANPASVVVMLNAPYQRTQQIRTGTTCSIEIPGHGEIEGHIEKSIPSVDVTTQTQTYLIRCSDVTLPEHLNVFVNIPIHTIANAVVVPKQSVLSNETQDEFWIMKMIDDSTAVKVDVRTGIENDSTIQIVEPKLDANAAIVVKGGYGLPDTARVVVQ